MYRNGKNAMIKREDMDPALIEMRRLAAYFGNPEKSFRVIHVAGTNGKGSVSLKVARGLEKMGFKTGLFTSPHIDTFRERVQVNGNLISKEHVVEHFEAILRAIQEKDIDLRFFEVVTMIALLEFRRQGCQYAVIECGIGGKLDATNIIDEPECSVITSIGLDHMDVIGDSLDAIASEKAGVIKQGLPCIVGPTCADRQPISERAKKLSSPLIHIKHQKSHNDVNTDIVQHVLGIVSQNHGFSEVSKEMLDFIHKVS